MYLGPCETSLLEFSTRKKLRLKSLNHFCEKASSYVWNDKQRHHNNNFVNLATKYVQSWKWKNLNKVSWCGSYTFIANFEHISHLLLFAVNSTVNSFACFVISRSSHPEVFCKKGLLKNFTKFTAKDLRQSLFLNKVTGLRPATLLRETLAQVFSCEFCEISKNTYSYRTPLGDCFWISFLPLY